MSRIGLRPIPVPSGVKIEISDDAVKVTGPKGTLSQNLVGGITVAQEDGHLKVERPGDTAQNRALHGLQRTLVANMIEGVTNGYKKTLQVVGVGYRAEMTGPTLRVAVGYSHSIEVLPRPGITFGTGQDAQRVFFITIEGIDKQLVGQTAAEIRKLRKPEPYKGKGIRYMGEQVRRKAGKSGKAGAKGGKK